jgi:hypothetical protein
MEHSIFYYKQPEEGLWFSLYATSSLCHLHYEIPITIPVIVLCFYLRYHTDSINQSWGVSALTLYRIYQILLNVTFLKYYLP